MIYVTRPSEPSIFRFSDIPLSQGEAHEFYSLPHEARSQREFDHRDVDHVVIGPLHHMFRGKCAFCEQGVSASPDHIVRFRPSRDAMGLTGKIDRDYYWWLHYSWENLYICCQECKIRKRNVFPVGDKRGGLLLAGPQLRRSERALLLDPCVDKTSLHLDCMPDGVLKPLSPKGEFTIELLQLNRKELVAGRNTAMAEVLGLLEHIEHTVRDFRMVTGPLKDDLWDQVSSKSHLPFKFARRAVAQRFLAENPNLTSSLGGVSRLRGVLRIAQPHLRVAVLRDDDFRRPSVSEVYRDESYSLKDRINLRQYFMKNHYIRSVELTNFKAIERLVLKIEDRPDGKVPWLMLLGENGTGKSSVLKAISLALMDSHQRSTTGETPASCLRRGASSGYIRIELTDQDEPITLRFTKDSFIGGVEEPPVLMMGYGATRLLPPPDRPASRFRPDVVRCENLFSPYKPLADATEWLISLPQDVFDDVAIGLKRLLLINDGKKLERSLIDGEPTVTCGGVPLDRLSDGYQSTIALAIDITMVVRQIWEKVSISEGIVLLDEMDAHLHPRWKMRIVEALRDVFPHIQFITTTHDPLCLRGMKGNIAVMRRDSDDQIHAWTSLPSPEGLHVDQILTSRYFGLHSTIDPLVEEKFDQYYELLAKRSSLSASEEAALVALKADLGDQKLLGETRREQLMYEAIDRFLAKERSMGNESMTEPLEEDLKQLLAQIWQANEDLGK